jgi:hypothetical protein
MCCMLCYNRPIGHAVLEKKTKLRKGLVSFLKNKWNNYFKKTCGCKPSTNCQKLWRRSEQ